MPRRIRDLFRQLFARPVARRPQSAGLRCQQLEDRTTPTAEVMIESAYDGTEGYSGASGCG